MSIKELLPELNENQWKLLERYIAEVRIDELERSIKPTETYDHYCIEKQHMDDRIKSLKGSDYGGNT